MAGQTNRDRSSLHSHGYRSRCELRWNWAEAGYNVVALTFAVSADRRRRVRAIPLGLRAHRIASPETSILRGAVCDYLRTMQIARDLFRGERPCS